MTLVGRHNAGRRPLSNAEFSELLCRAAEEPGRSDQQRRALRRAGRAAWRWPVEASQLRTDNRALTELRYVGPYIAALMTEWLETSPRVPAPPPVRRDFLTRVEVDRIMGHPLPWHVRGDLQVHTLGSDGTESIAAMADAARARGLRYLAITDHSRGLPIAHGMNEEQFARQGQSIARRNAAHSATGFRLLRGVELNLSPAGEPDLDRNFLSEFDIILGAFHSRLRLEEDQTERYLAALRRPAFHVLAHPRGRIFNYRLGLHADWRRVFTRIRECDRAVEIDGYPDRQDLDVRLLHLAGEMGVRISIGSDAHASSQLEFLNYGVAAALSVGIAAERIINCMEVDDLLAWSRNLNCRE